MNMHWRYGREARACDGSTTNPAHATRDMAKVTCPRCLARMKSRADEIKAYEAAKSEVAK